MLFCTQQFLVFYAAVFAAYWLLPWARARVWLLLAASVVFYATWDVSLAALICGTATANYALALWLDASDGRRRKWLLAVSVVGNLALLGYFKYANFFLGSLEEALRAAGAAVSFPVLSVLLPIGISFYTFEAISYAVDVYHRKLPAERNLPNFLLFILFFPHLIAGPIVRARDFLPQVRRPKRFDWARLHLGAQFFLMGAFKKVVIADRLAMIVDPVFEDAAAYSTQTLWLATFAWALQVYCDFSGYTDMALGCAHGLGYKLAQNFHMPYLAANISQFWRRWHISLSSWLRDYLFIPLGGSRGGYWLVARNLLIVMALGGLWHGANWPYVVFGVLQGLMLTAHYVFRDWCRGRPTLDAALRTPAGVVLRVAVTFVTFCLTLVVFRSPSLAAGGQMLWAMVVPRGGADLPLDAANLWFAAAVVGAAHAVGWTGWWERIAARAPAPVVGLGQAACLSLAITLAVGARRAFVYFQF